VRPRQPYSSVYFPFLLTGKTAAYIIPCLEKIDMTKEQTQGETVRRPCTTWLI
jgi:hypothetical protein